MDLFLEDSAHEKLLRPLVRRVGREEDVDLTIRVRNAQGGRAGAVKSFRDEQKLLEEGVGGTALPDVLVVAIDGNCATFANKRKEIQRATHSRFEHLVVPACPDPHIERWYVVDPQSFQQVVGNWPESPSRKCDRGVYKKVLADAAEGGTRQSLLGGVEFAEELVAAMDIYRAGKNDRSFGDFVETLRARMRLAAARSGGR